MRREHPTVFIAHSQADEARKDRLVAHLGALEGQGWLDVWDEGRVRPGQDWENEVQRALDRASVAVLLVTADFLSSDEQLRERLTRPRGDRLRLFPILVKPCAWEVVAPLRALSLYPPDKRALS